MYMYYILLFERAHIAHKQGWMKVVENSAHAYIQNKYITVSMRYAYTKDEEEKNERKTKELLYIRVEKGFIYFE